MNTIAARVRSQVGIGDTARFGNRILNAVGNAHIRLSVRRRAIAGAGGRVGAVIHKARCRYANDHHCIAHRHAIDLDFAAKIGHQIFQIGLVAGCVGDPIFLS